MSESLHRDLGRLEGQMGAIDKRLGKIEDDMKEVLTTLQQAKGGWRTLIMVGSACAALSSAITAVWVYLSGKHL